MSYNVEIQNKVNMKMNRYNNLFNNRIMFISIHGDPMTQIGGIQSGGQNVYVRELVYKLDSLGNSVDVFTHWTDESLPQVQKIGNNSRVIRIDGGKKGFVPKNDMYDMLPNILLQIEEVIEDFDSYDMIHSNYWLSGWIGQILQDKLNIARVHTSHSLGIVRNNGIYIEKDYKVDNRLICEKDTLQSASAVIATTEFEKSILKEHYSILDENIFVIPCGVDTKIFNSFKKHENKYFSKDKKTILFVGRFEENKGLDVLLEAISILNKRNYNNDLDIELAIVGGDYLDVAEDKISNEKRKYLKIINENGISHVTKFVGPLNHEELADCYFNAYVTVVPSFYESFGMVSLEAMACACPVIASRTSGLECNIKDNKNGLLFETKNSYDLAEKISIILHDKEKRDILSKHAVIHSANYTWDKIAFDMLSAYCEVKRWKRISNSKTSNVY